MGKHDIIVPTKPPTLAFLREAISAARKQAKKKYWANLNELAPDTSFAVSEALEEEYGEDYGTVALSIGYDNDGYRYMIANSPAYFSYEPRWVTYWVTAEVTYDGERKGDEPLTRLLQKEVVAAVNRLDPVSP